MAALKRAGYNAVRTAHHAPSSAFLAAADALGLLVLYEFFDVWDVAKNSHDGHVGFGDSWRRDVTALMERDRSRPCIVMWSVGNEVADRAGAYFKQPRRVRVRVAEWVQQK